MPHPRTAPTTPARTTRRSTRRRSFTALLAGLLAATSARVTGVVAQGIAGDAMAKAPAAHSPYGRAEHMWFMPGGMRFSGWTIDPSSPKTPITAYVLVDGKVAGRTVANLARPDVATAHPSAGPNHGFRFKVLVKEGTHQICVKARNIYHGENVVLRCQTRTLDYGPIGALQRVTVKHGKIAVSGWTLDWDRQKSPLTVRVTLDGVATNVVADDPNDAALKPNHGSAGANHGFALTLPATQG